MRINKKLRIGLVAFGTDGDIQPLVELAIGLHEHGHAVELVIVCLRGRDYSHLQKEEFNVNVIPYPKLSALNEFSEKEFWNFSDAEFSRYFNTQFNVVRNTIRRWSNVLAKKVDILVSIRLMYPVRFSAEEHKIPYVCLHFAHSFIKSRHYPPLGSEDFSFDDNIAAWQAGDLYTNQYLLPDINKFREHYTLESCTDFYTQVHHSSELNLVAFSPNLLPYNLDWEKNFHLCGYFKPNTNATLNSIDSAIQKFIGYDDKVIAVTFGSLLEYEEKPAEFLKQISEAIREQGIRAVILTKKNDGLISDEQIFYADGYVNHQHLFSRCKFVVHHGGAGTTHAVTACGVPSLLISYGFDQFSIGDLLIKLNICYGIIARKNFDREKFKSLLRKAITDVSLRDKAIELGKAISTEHGIKRAVELIEVSYG